MWRCDVEHLELRDPARRAEKQRLVVVLYYLELLATLEALHESIPLSMVHVDVLIAREEEELASLVCLERIVALVP